MFHFTLTTTSCHRSSAFFKALSAPHNFPGPEQFPDELTFDYHTPQDSGQPESEDNENDENSEVELETTSSSTEEPGSTSPPSFIPSLLHAPIYRPSGKWEWAANQDLEEIQSHFISAGAICSAFLKEARIGDSRIKYVCKSWPKAKPWHGFHQELALYKTGLKPLQGLVVPSIINVYASVGDISIAFEPPHPSFWVEASTDMPLALKRKCIDAFKRIHDQRILHGDVELRHMLIGADGRVTIIDFEASRCLSAIPDVGLGSARPEEIRKEMRKVLVKLDYPGAREKELKRQRTMTEDGGEQPIPRAEWLTDWIGPVPAPRRFIMPGQTPELAEAQLQSFLKLLDRMQVQELTSRGLYSPPSSPPLPPITISGHGSPQVGTRKRKRRCSQTSRTSRTLSQRAAAINEVPSKRSPHLVTPSILGAEVDSAPEDSPRQTVRVLTKRKREEADVVGDARFEPDSPPPSKVLKLDLVCNEGAVNLMIQENPIESPAVGSAGSSRTAWRRTWDGVKNWITLW